MKTQLPSKYTWKSSREPLGLREPRDENPCRCTISEAHFKQFTSF